MSLGCNATVDCERSSFCTALFLEVSVMRLSGHGDDFGRNLRPKFYHTAPSLAEDSSRHPEGT